MRGFALPFLRRAIAASRAEAVALGAVTAALAPARRERLADRRVRGEAKGG